MTIQLASFAINPPVLLAPMAGITDLPFRQIVARFGAGLLMSEMVASQEVVQKRIPARARARLKASDASPARSPLSAVQLAGRDPFWLAEAARYAEGQGAALIDINMGCPAKRVTARGGNGACGAALMREPDLALRLIEAVVGAVGVPVSVKMRLGWEEGALNAPRIAALAEGAGAQMLTVHGRTRNQFYQGRADWEAIFAVKEAVGIPVIANGDIVDAPSATRALELSGGDGVMVGRGARGAPWRLAQIAHALYGAPHQRIEAPTGAALADLIAAHYEAQLSFYGTQMGMRTARKHLGWYLDEAGASRDAPAYAARRAAVLRSEEPSQVLELMRALVLELADAPRTRADAA